MDLIEHLEDQKEFSERVFGPRPRLGRVVDHIEKELDEIKEDPYDLEGWVDVILLALDGAWRVGYTPEEVTKAIADKHAKNKKLGWPDQAGMRSE